ncbi:putative hydrolase [Kockovaella imperatae]|uniref:Putative hydrolase n=1 Tax=Kockovaella imperatae TaxID=4999 RepID=A0A1Y1UL21_9TREE|nr:putative hydrolase [Kockovaella imperatae]ORX38682.1 putative hydrolase [Kockovaella imperatae]
MAPQKIIIDTDPGVDDVLAILMALASPEVDVSLISIVFGNTHAPGAHSNLLKIYHLLAQEVAAVPAAAARYHRLEGQTKTRLALGDDSPIGGEKAVAAYFHGLDGLSNISETHPEFTPPPLDPGAVHAHLDILKTPAHEVILETLKSEPEGTVTIVALGPLTNIAHAYQADPVTLARVHSVVWMGGALDHPGNTSPVAEFNCFADPYAATIIMEACKAGEIKLVIAPLDITTPHTIPFSDLIDPSIGIPPSDSSGQSSKLSPPGPLKTFISHMLSRVRGLHVSFGLPDAMEMHDPLAVWYALSNASRAPLDTAEGWHLRPRDFKVERKGEFTRGMCVVDRRGTTEDQGENRAFDLAKEHNANKTEASAVDNGERDRDGSKIVKAGHLPMVIVKTPGKEVLRSLLLDRVFGQTV